jgi:hypothetical protein
MLRVLRRGEDVVALVVDELGERIFHGPRAREAAVEQIALRALVARHPLDTQRDAGDRVGERESLERIADEANPSRAVGRRAGSTDRLRERFVVGEREDEGDLARPRATHDQLGADRAGKRVDDEQQSPRVAERVLHPVERRARKRMRGRMEEPARIVGARESPDPHAVGAESDLDALGGEAREIGAGLEADAVEERDERLGWRQHRDREV